MDAIREPGRRVIGTCRHFAVLSCALLRYRGIAARARCGFATYFQPGQGLDHWITEYRSSDDSRWVRIDSEVVGQQVLVHTEDLRDGEFLTGGEAWAAFRAGRIDAARFGVYGTQNWGPGEIRGNAIRDLAALNKVEMLPWDEWRAWRRPTGARPAPTTTMCSTRSPPCAPPASRPPSRTSTPATSCRCPPSSFPSVRS
ncbi:MAG: transglutaminase domain-containing protein [Streptosporangiaceae bacterium]